MAAATFEEAQMTWLVRNPSFGLATAPDWELPEEDEVLAPLATLGATRVGSLAPPPSSAPPVVARSLEPYQPLYE